jgi:signal transduction histidine kinase/DNA-binding response OmpR family regulator
LSGRPSSDPTDEVRDSWSPLPLVQNRAEEAELRREQRRRRETVVIPRLRGVGYLGLWLGVAAHNWLLLGELHGRLLVGFGSVLLLYFAISKVALGRYYREDARFDLSTAFLAGDIAVLVLTLYASGGEKSWLLPVLCMRVADQVGSSPRRAFSFAILTAVLHMLLVAYMAGVEQRGFPLSAELAKVGFLFACNCYLALAAGPGERQRKREVRNAALMRNLIDELGVKTEQLQVERARAEAANHAKTAFLSNMSHEIRTPLNAVLGTCELLLEERLSPQQHTMVQTVNVAGRSLLGLVNDVLDMAKIEAGKLALVTADMDLLQVVESVLSPLRVLATSKRLELRLESSGIPGAPVRGDAMRLGQVLSNLVGNAVKFTETGRITLRVTQCAQTPQALRFAFAVEDTGIGMTQEASARVFDPFEQADDSTTRRFGGTGLGLSISRRLVAMMGGELTLHTAPGCGSRFEFELEFPHGMLAPDKAEGIDRVRNATRLRALAPRVLAAEDTEVNRALLQRMLEGLGCHVTGVENGERALALLAGDHRFDLVLMDWHMPVMDGLQAASAVREWERIHGRERVPIVGFTASAFVDEVERCKKAGMDHVLHKPLVKAQLEMVLWECLLHEQVEADRAARPIAPAPTAQLDSVLDPRVIEELVDLESMETGFLYRLFSSFLERAPRLLSNLSEAAARADVERLKWLAHELRGSAGSMGARRLAAILAELEQRVHEEPAADPTPMIAAAEREFARAAEELGAVLRRRGLSRLPVHSA